MILWLKWLFSPVGRWTAALGTAAAILFAAYWKGRREGVSELKKEQEDELNRRSQAALQADIGVRRDVSAGRLLENDGHRRE
jgi:membrane protein implicated in regulation of membrane protease activity